MWVLDSSRAAHNPHSGNADPQGQWGQAQGPVMPCTQEEEVSRTCVLGFYSCGAGLFLALGPELFLWQRDELPWGLILSRPLKCHSLKHLAKVPQSQLSQSR